MTTTPIDALAPIDHADELILHAAGNLLRERGIALSASNDRYSREDFTGRECREAADAITSALALLGALGLLTPIAAPVQS